MSGGTISTLVGDGTCLDGGDGGPATTATVDTSSDLAVDGLGNLYIVDSANDAVRVVFASDSDDGGYL